MSMAGIFFSLNRAYNELMVTSHSHTTNSLLNGILIASSSSEKHPTIRGENETTDVNSSLSLRGRGNSYTTIFKHM